MSGVFKFTKIKLVTGHLILLAVAAAAVWFIREQTRRLSEEDPGEQDARRRIFLISKTLTRLYEAETLGIAISRNADGDHLATYAGIIREVKRDMDSLRRHLPAPRQKQQINAVQALLSQKIENMKALVEINLRQAPVDLYDRFVTGLSALRDTTLAAPNIRVRRETSVDSVYIQPPKRGFWSIFKSKPSPVLRVNTSERIVLDTLPPVARAPYQNADTALLTIRSAWTEYQEQEQSRTRELYRQEIAMLRNGQHISEQIKHILTELESDEVRATLARADERGEITRELSHTIAAVAMIASLFVIIFIALILNDISRGQRYRKALEEANAYARKLLNGREKLMLAVSHDIKSPLNSITGYAELLDNTPLAERQHHFLDNMKNSATHILQLVNNLLDYSKLEAGKMEVEVVRYSPGKLLLETAAALLPQASGKGLRLLTDVDDALLRDCNGDAIKIRRIVINLLSNAIKYTGQGSVTLSARAVGEEPAGMEIAVADTGDGMTDEEQRLIFEEFTRLDATHNNGAEGTGLGLTITRQLVHLLGGTITLASAKGAGSTFTVHLPVAEMI
ncbi:MAG: HAMP domain-containing histidine kinase, partial [Odoribacteraceae bacterium]|nr:HAMP domain-containing histidine kinase [Odoribacteraceae bacterium]